MAFAAKKKKQKTKHKTHSQQTTTKHKKNQKKQTKTTKKKQKKKTKTATGVASLTAKCFHLGVNWQRKFDALLHRSDLIDVTPDMLKTQDLFAKAEIACHDPKQIRRLANQCVQAWGLKKPGAACVTRTRDPIITNDVLYRLS